MHYRIPGILSLALAFTAMGMADYYLFGFAVWLGVAYAAIVPFALLNNIYVYCRKCPHIHDGTCRRVVFGPVVKMLFKALPPGPYSIRELILQLVPAAVYVLFPQPWLIRDVRLFAIFWALMACAIAIQVFFICPKCQNSYCLYRIRRPATR
jgi:hypothetical protein